MSDPAAAFREYMRLQRKQEAGGLTLEELERWRKLKRQLSQRLRTAPTGGASDTRGSVRVPMNLSVSFESPGKIGQSLMTNLSRGGLFILTNAPLPLGTRLRLRIRIESEDREVELPAEVVSHNVGPGMTAQGRGMGVRFDRLRKDEQALVDALYQGALENALQDKAGPS